MFGLGSVLVLGTFRMSRRGSVFSSSPFGMFGVRPVPTMRLAQLLRFFEVVTFAGDKGRGCKNQEQVEGFHRAP